MNEINDEVSEKNLKTSKDAIVLDSLSEESLRKSGAKLSQSNSLNYPNVRNNTGLVANYYPPFNSITIAITAGS